MLRDAAALAPGAELRADVCVIGSGAAGATIARELVGSGLDVLVLEAGGNRLERRAQDTYRGVVEDGGDHDPLDRVRQKRVGGTTGQWGGRCSPLDPLDFEHRPWIAHSGWPISREDLDPYYVRAHRHLDLGEFEYRADDALAGAPDLVLRDGAGARFTDSAIWRWSPPMKFARVVRTELAADPGVTVYRHANVVRLERGGDGGAIERVVFAPAPGVELTARARAYVVAAGGLETARLLLASNRETPGGVGNEHDRVGRFYMTHPVAEVGRIRFAGDVPPAACAYELTRDGVYCRRHLRVSPSTQRELHLHNLALAFWYPDPQDPGHGDPLLSAFALTKLAMARGGLNWKATGVHRRYGATRGAAAHVRNVATGLPAVARYGGEWVRRRWLAPRALPSFLTTGAAGYLRFRFDAEEAPNPDNRVTLSRDRDAFGVPRLSVRYRLSSDDRRSVLRSIAVVAEDFRRLGIGTVDVPEAAEGLEDFTFGDGTHQMGLTRMSASPRSGVVDRNCRVHGAPNLFVASSAVFPTGGSVGPTLTIVALAVRVADTLRHELSAPAVA